MTDPARTPPSDTAEDTRTRLLDAATHIFAARGIHGLSMRAVAEQAQAKNTAAVHYHFKDREGLLTAVLDRVTDAMRQDVSLDEARAFGLDISGTNALATTVALIFAPVLTLDQRHPKWGADGLRLVSRVILGDANDLAQRLEATTELDMQAMIDILSPLLPGLARDMLHQRLDLAVVTVICGTVALRAQGDVTHDMRRTLAQGLLAYVTAGLEAIAPRNADVP